ncbi:MULTISPECIES: NAD(P)/FAD-dependent oxidoreductase [unclassified Nocardia]|uniref:flavin-containing monooxygenase n=1 Tax=unclassified Nocardia TaxID=2637762 RepID=UPI001CE43A3B|nr:MULTISPECIES: NAD(P)/FAD-dependent oxidoreductase [unclassified Nocardia]
MSGQVIKEGHGTTARHAHVVIVGCGFAGLGTAIRLIERGFTDLLILERGDDVGGTWRDNTYPGATCDVPSHLYSYSFALNPEWTRSFSPQPEIQQYLRDIADRYQVREKVVFGCEMLDAQWNEADARWEIQTSQGPFTADIAVSAVGALCEPKLPDIKGIHTFEGKIFHSARWDHEAELTGKRVAVVGTGASAIQIVPAVAPDAAQLDVYQRSAPWVLPRLDRGYFALERFAFKHVPGLQRLLRAAIYANRELFVFGQTKYPRLAVFYEFMARVKMWLEIRDPALRRKVTPDYRLGCKRMLISNNYYPALGRDNVEVVTGGIKEIRENSIVAEDGTERPADAIVLATGFRVTNSPTWDLFRGRDGRTLAEIYAAEGAHAYKGTAVANFPNAFVILGPNTGLSYTSSIYTIESQINYIVDAVATIAERGLRTVEVRKDLETEYTRQVQQMMDGSIWLAGGCTSWFLDENGKNTTLWPDFSFRFRRLVRKFDAEAYETTTRADEVIARTA